MEQMLEADEESNKLEDSWMDSRTRRGAREIMKRRQEIQVYRERREGISGRMRCATAVV